MLTLTLKYGKSSVNIACKMYINFLSIKGNTKYKK